MAFTTEAGKTMQLTLLSLISIAPGHASITGRGHVYYFGARVDVEVVDVSTLDDPDGLAPSVVRKSKVQIMRCFEDALQQALYHEGIVEQRLHLQGGRVVLGEITLDEFQHVELTSCLERRTSSWRFSPEIHGYFDLRFTLKPPPPPPEPLPPPPPQCSP